MDTFTALADPTRRRIIESLAAGETSFGELADKFEMSRPAVSQHLRVLADAGLVAADAEGTRRIYRLVPEGWAGLRDYLDTMWDDALAAYARAARNTEGRSRK